MSETTPTVVEEPKKKRNWLAFILEDGSLSMGRVMGWLTFGLLYFMWIAERPVPETLMSTFFALIGYNFGKKLAVPAAALLNAAMSKKQGISEEDKVRLKQEVKAELTSEKG